MERFIHGLKVLWRSERLLSKNELRLIAQKAQFNALAGLVALFGLVMLSLAVFFALVPYWGQAWAALAVAAADFVLAGILFASAMAVKPSAEVEMVQEMRDTALSDIEHEVSRADAELRALGDEVRQFVRNPVDALLPAVLGPVLTAVTRSLKSKK
jgi:hypothetical protein